MFSPFPFSTPHGPNPFGLTEIAEMSGALRLMLARVKFHLPGMDALKRDVGLNC